VIFFVLFILAILPRISLPLAIQLTMFQFF